MVATFVDSIVTYDPGRLRMSLSDGDAEHFSLPGLRHVHFGFARERSMVPVSARPNLSEVTYPSE